MARRGKINKGRDSLLVITSTDADFLRKSSHVYSAPILLSASFFYALVIHVGTGSCDQHHAAPDRNGENTPHTIVTQGKHLLLHFMFHQSIAIRDHIFVPA